jgi:hypothetical protein
VRKAFDEAWALPFRAFLRSHINPFSVVRNGEDALHAYLSKAGNQSRWTKSQTTKVFTACQNIATVCELSGTVNTVNEDFYIDLQDEIARELRMLESDEIESEALAHRITEIYRKLHPSNNLCSIPGVGEHTAPIFLAVVGNPSRFRNQSAFANWEGVVPGARQSSDMQSKGLRMTKAGPSIMRMALYQAGDIGRRWDPQLAAVYHREMVYHGKNHRQAMGAVMSHLGARVLRVLKEDRPYELRDIAGNLISKNDARTLILSRYHVPEVIRRERRRRNPKINKEMGRYSTNEAATAPQPASLQAISK